MIEAPSHLLTDYRLIITGFTATQKKTKLIVDGDSRSNGKPLPLNAVDSSLTSPTPKDTKKIMVTALNFLAFFSLAMPVGK